VASSADSPAPRRAADPDVRNRAPVNRWRDRLGYGRREHLNASTGDPGCGEHTYARYHKYPRTVTRNTIARRGLDARNPKYAEQRIFVRRQK